MPGESAASVWMKASLFALTMPLRDAEVEEALELAREAGEVAVGIADGEDRRPDLHVPAGDERRGLGGVGELEDREVVLLVPRDHLGGGDGAARELDAHVATEVDDVERGGDVLVREEDEAGAEPAVGPGDAHHARLRGLVDVLDVRRLALRQIVGLAGGLRARRRLRMRAGSRGGGDGRGRGAGRDHRDRLGLGLLALRRGDEEERSRRGRERECPPHTPRSFMYVR